jgi:2,4-dienoyl-CoA reductase-like NADH-dependent reductase (Old Yellow Enzyme family)
METEYGALFKPITIGSMHIKNRIGMAPMFTKYATESGEVTDKLIEYLYGEQKAE